MNPPRWYRKGSPNPLSSLEILCLSYFDEVVDSRGVRVVSDEIVTLQWDIRVQVRLNPDVMFHEAFLMLIREEIDPEMFSKCIHEIRLMFDVLDDPTDFDTVSDYRLFIEYLHRHGFIGEDVYHEKMIASEPSE